MIIYKYFKTDFPTKTFQDIKGIKEIMLKDYPKTMTHCDFCAVTMKRLLAISTEILNITSQLCHNSCKYFHDFSLGEIPCITIKEYVPALSYFNKHILNNISEEQRYYYNISLPSM